MPAFQIPCLKSLTRGSAAVFAKDYLSRLQSGLQSGLCQCAVLTNLRDRHLSVCKTFANSAVKNPDCQHWFPEERTGAYHSNHLHYNRQRVEPFNRT